MKDIVGLVMRYVASVGIVWLGIQVASEIWTALPQDWKPQLRLAVAACLVARGLVYLVTDLINPPTKH